MTEPVLRLEPDRVGVDPGGQVVVEVTVFNPGNRVEGYDLDVVSTEPMPWATVSPETLSVYPQQEETAVVTFAPPLGTQAPGGSVPFGVRVRSQVDATATAVVEGDLDVSTQAGLQASITPVTSKGRWSARHRVSIVNGGNGTAQLRVTAQDPDEALGFLVTPAAVEVAPGEQAQLRVKVRTRAPVLRGTPTRLPFQVTCEPAEADDLGVAPRGTSTAERPVLDAAFEQRPILTRTVVALATLLVLALVAALVYALRSQSDDPPGEDKLTNPPTPTGFAVVDTVSPTEIELTWDEMEDVDGFRLVYVDPETDKKLEPKDLKPATLVAAEVEPDTAMCFTLAAVRADLASRPTERVCSRTEQVLTPPSRPADEPSPSVTVSSPDPTPVTPIDPPTSDGSGGTETVDPETSDGPRDFVSPLYIGSPDDGGQQTLEGDLQALTDVGVEAAMLLTDRFDLRLVDSSAALATGAPSPAPAPPSERAQPVSSWMVYVDGDTAEAAREACQAAWAALEATGEEVRPVEACLTTYEVLDRPAAASPSPNA